MPVRDGEEMMMEKNRRSIGLLSVVDLEGLLRDMDPTERKQYVSQVAAMYELLDQELNRAILTQIDYLARHAIGDEVLICRGGINFGEVLRSYWAELRAEHMENIKPKEEFDQHKITPE